MNTIAVRNRFYVAADTAHRDSTKINPQHNKYTLEDAIEHAQHILRRDPTKSEVSIVEIIRVVRRADVPIEVLQVTEAPPY